MATPSTVLGQVESLYVGYFGRAGDPSGVNSWVNAINTGKATFASIAASFATSPEALNKYPYLTTPFISSPTTFVNSVYANLFNRVPDAAGLTFWVNYLNANNGNSTAAGLFISTIITSAASGGVDDNAVQAKANYAGDFTTQYSNSTSTFNAAAANQSTTQLATVVDSTTQATAIATTATFITTAPGPTVSIVAGTFNYTATQAKTLFIADNTPAIKNLTAATVINGTSGQNNTLKIFSDGTVAGANFQPSQITGVSTIFINNLEGATGATPTTAINAAGVVGLTTLQIDTPFSGINGAALVLTVTVAAQTISLATVAAAATGANSFTLRQASTTDTAETFVVQAVASGAAGVILDTSGTKVATLTITSAGTGTANNSTFTLTDTGAVLTKLVLTGTSGLAITTSGAFSASGLATVDASGTSGGSSLTIAAATTITSNFAYTGGSGADTLDLSGTTGAGAVLVGGTNVTTAAQLNGMTLNGGAGTTDTLIVGTVLGQTTAAISTTNITLFENLGWSTATGTMDFSKWSPAGFVSEQFTGTVGGAVIINNGLSAMAVNIGNSTFGGNTLTINQGNGVAGTGTADTLTETVGSTTAAATTFGGLVTINGYETINITGRGAAATYGAITATASTGGNEAITLADSVAITWGAITESGSATSLTVTGVGATTLGALTGVTTVDASAATGAFTMAIAAASSNGTNGMVIKGATTQANVLTGTHYGDTITTGTAGDTIYSAGGADSITMATGHARQTIQYGNAAGDASIANATTLQGLKVLGFTADATAATINGFTAGTSGDIFQIKVASWTQQSTTSATGHNDYGFVTGAGFTSADGAALAGVLTAGAAAVVQTVTLAGTTLATATNVLFDGIASYANAAALATALNGAGNVAFTGTGAVSGNAANFRDVHLLTAYLNSTDSNVHIADVVISNGNATYTATNALGAGGTLAAHDLATLVGVTALSSLKVGDFNFIS